MTATERPFFYGTGRWRALRALVVLVLGLVLAAGLAAAWPRAGDPSAVEVELAGNSEELGQRLGEGCAPWPQDSPACLEAAASARDAVTRDFWLIGAYVLAAGGLCWLGAGTAGGRRRTRRFLAAAGAAAVAAGVFDLIENGALLEALQPDVTFDRWIHVASVAATIKWSLAPLVIAGTLWALVVFLQGRPELPPAASGEALARRVRWDERFAPGPDDRFGICLSGGGVRSASFSLGAVQRLEEGDPQAGRPSYLEGADYLTAVSGGGYFAGASQLLAARTAVDGERAAGPPPPPFADGSAEQDHLRRHANYLADTAGEWASALGQTFGKLLANLVLLGLVVIAVAQPLGWMGRLLLGVDPDATAPTDWPAIPEAVWWGLLLTAVPALVLANGRRFQATRAVGARGVVRRIAGPVALAAGVAATILGVTAVLLPALDGLGRRAPDWLKASDGMVGAAWPTAVLAAVLGWLKTKAMKKETSGGAAPAQGEDADGAGGKGFALPFAGGWAEVVAGPLVALVVLGYIVALAAVAHEQGPNGAAFHIGTFGVPTLAVFGLAVVVVVGVGSAVDAVSWSMHRFYKRRLWSAFAYDPELRGERDWADSTSLTKDAAPLPGRPKLVLCAAAQVSGPDRAPPGRRAVSWTFDADYVGGPEIGWCTTAEMLAALEPKGLAGDVSMFGAVAISGAAFGSAMGRHSKGSLNSVMALTNARLGVWLPNPAQVHEQRWRYRPRNLWYLVSEIFGRFPADGRWVLVSDGGHFENLGLVELFRRRCRRIVCLDASGDDTGRAATIAEALRLAEEELGVVVEMQRPWTSTPGSDPDRSDLPERVRDSLDARLAMDSVVWGTVEYPEISGLDPGRRKGLLVIGRAVLDASDPWPVLSYAGGQEAFPNDPTADQWFDHEQFTNYRLLGRRVASRLIQVTKELEGEGWRWPTPRRDEVGGAPG